VLPRFPLFSYSSCAPCSCPASYFCPFYFFLFLLSFSRSIFFSWGPRPKRARFLAREATTCFLLPGPTTTQRPWTRGQWVCHTPDCPFTTDASHSPVSPSILHTILPIIFFPQPPFNTFAHRRPTHVWEKNNLTTCLGTRIPTLKALLHHRCPLISSEAGCKVPLIFVRH